MVNTVDNNEIGLGGADGIFDFTYISDSSQADIIVVIWPAAFPGPVYGWTTLIDSNEDGYLKKQ